MKLLSPSATQRPFNEEGACPVESPEDESCAWAVADSEKRHTTKRMRPVLATDSPSPSGLALGAIWTAGLGMADSFFESYWGQTRISLTRFPPTDVGAAAPHVNHARQQCRPKSWKTSRSVVAESCR